MTKAILRARWHYHDHLCGCSECCNCRQKVKLLTSVTSQLTEKVCLSSVLELLSVVGGL